MFFATFAPFCGKKGSAVLKYKFSTCILVFILFSASTIFAAQNQQVLQKLAALEKVGPKFSFIVFGDNRSGDEIYRQIVSLAMERMPAFIVNTGDMIATPGDMQEWARFWEISRPITVPYFLTVGNHDINSKVPFSGKKYLEQVDLPGKELYYSFVAGNSLFIVLDSYIDDQEKMIAGEQRKWLEGVLATSTQKHKFVFVHHPLYTEKDKGKHHGNSMDRYKEERDRLQALFVKHKVSMVFAGHEHLYLRKTVDGILHVITGGGGAPLYSAEDDGGYHHFVRIHVDGDKVKAEVVDVNGKTRDRSDR
jgi:predicted phosphodiesterase